MYFLGYSVGKSCFVLVFFWCQYDCVYARMGRAWLLRLGLVILSFFVRAFVMPKPMNTCSSMNLIVLGFYLRSADGSMFPPLSCW